MRAHRPSLLSRLISVQHPSLGAVSKLRKILISTFANSMTLRMACLSPCHFARSLRGCIRAVVLPKESLASIVLRTTETCPSTALGTTVGSNFFANGLRNVLQVRKDWAGPYDELDFLLPDLFDKVVPRLLPPLETSGRTIIPSLVHCDLWYGNANIVNEETEEGIVYDPAAFWAHNEYELGNWRPARNQFTRLYFGEYHSHVPTAEPAEDYDDRNALYALTIRLARCGTLLNPGGVCSDGH
ncbi:hypothetical protein QC763_100390 [Podospora pseudopauciseta]|uniref:protein-ribulosamine 3-kinase n=1 Tax=Podospora pseudopauciseta TaxID=2093780 RepID=A0ABR0HVP0_9PEZI|nr:hypothetical protein QC763_100390 [Podospora pseudopauciseta]